MEEGCYWRMFDDEILKWREKNVSTNPAVMCNFLWLGQITPGIR